ncbi:MAG: TlpA disulfide reductase family protein [Cyclobacteriaceae bacterium]
MYSLSGQAQTGSVPKTELMSLNGDRVGAETILNKEGATVISFWATWCKPCILELNELNDLYENWNKESNVRIVAISIDDARSSSKVPSFVNSRGWEFDIFLDVNSDFKRALNINNIPHSLLVDKSGMIVWQHAGYVPGDEEVLYDELLKLQK